MFDRLVGKIRTGFARIRMRLTEQHCSQKKQAGLMQPEAQYYGTDITFLPVPILWKRLWHSSRLLAPPIFVVFLLRRLLGIGLMPLIATRRPEEIHCLSFDELPPRVRAEFAKLDSEVRNTGFELAFYNKSQQIGHRQTYSASYLHHDRTIWATTIWNS